MCRFLCDHLMRKWPLSKHIYFYRPFFDSKTVPDKVPFHVMAEGDVESFPDLPEYCVDVPAEGRELLCQEGRLLGLTGPSQFG